MNITEIPKGQEYIGYIWMSDSKESKEYHNPAAIDLLEKMTDVSNPFIVEGQLYYEKENKSYSIKYVDGEHIVNEYDLGNKPKELIVDDLRQIKKFIPNRLKASKIVFIQYWKPEKDALCDDMETLVPGPLVFVGFEYERKEENKS